MKRITEICDHQGQFQGHQGKKRCETFPDRLVTLKSLGLHIYLGKSFTNHINYTLIPEDYFAIKPALLRSLVPEIFKHESVQE